MSQLHESHVFTYHDHLFKHTKTLFKRSRQRHFNRQKVTVKAEDRAKLQRLNQGSKSEGFAFHCENLIQQYGVDTAIAFCESLGIQAPSYRVGQDVAHYHKNSMESAEKRLASPKWWERKLTKHWAQKSEIAQINRGNVRKGAAAYISNDSLDKFKEAKAKEAVWKTQNVFVSSDGEEVSLEPQEGKPTEAEKRFAEYMVRIKGIEELANQSACDAGVIKALPKHLKQGAGGAFADLKHLDELDQHSGVMGIFVTLTAPSRTHRYRFQRKTQKLEQNPRYDYDSTPIVARDWLQETWKLVQTEWKRNTKNINPIQAYGYRVTEAHHDGVPHYHYALWIDASDVKRALSIFYQRALRGEFVTRAERFEHKAWERAKLRGEDVPEERKARYCKQGKPQDAIERGATKHRLNFKIIDTSGTGSMTAYMMKYISKGIQGQDWEDLQSGETSSESLIRILAHRSLWGLRQFSFYNVPSVGVWRELRRIPETIVKHDALLLKAHKAVNQTHKNKQGESRKSGDWVAYTQLNGGVYCPSRKRPIKIAREWKTHDDGNYQVNDYGEVIETVKGLISDRGNTIHTRLKTWYAVNIGSLKQLLIQKHLKTAETSLDELPNFESDIQTIIEQAKTQKKLHKLTEFVGYEHARSRAQRRGYHQKGQRFAPWTRCNNFPRPQIEQKPSGFSALNLQDQAVVESML